MSASLLSAALLVLAVQQTPEEMSTLALLKSTFLPQSKKQSSSPQPMKIISAGAGRTGTSSLKTALSRLGLKTYHMKDGVMDTPGHDTVWMEYSEAEKLKRGNPELLRAIIDKMAADGFNATTDMPACILYNELMKQYPDARVILSVRSSPEVWASSVLSTIGRNANVLSRVPWRWITFMRQFLSFLDWMWAEFGLDIEEDFDRETLLPKHDALVKAHEAWVARVKRSVPSGKLLVFQPTDGWRPLCDFVSPVDAQIAAACEEVLASGEPYPHVNDSSTIKGTLAVFIAISYMVLASPLLLVACCVIRMRRRAAPPKGRTGVKRA